MTGSDGQRSEENAPEVASGVAPGSLSVLLAELARLPPADLGAAWDSWLRPGAVVGRFELVREIGRGGLGVVYEARDRELGRSVAFKAVKAGGTAALREERLLREAETAARLSHPNIATLYDVGRSEHGPYLVLELLRGETLEDRLGQGRVPLREALRIGVEIARGAAHAHAQGVVHRDLKPSNVFLCEDGQVKVLDFGLAHAFGQRRADGGTPSSMAPEQWKGAPEDERTDVFALGVMLHRMLSGEVPFPEDDGGKAVRSAQRAPALEVPDEPALGELVGKMLEKDPTLRPRDGGIVLSALSAFKGELERSASGPSSPVRARRRRPWRVPALVAAGILLGTGAAVVALRRPAPSIPPAIPADGRIDELLGMWKHAAPDFPLLAEARALVKRLASTTAPAKQSAALARSGAPGPSVAVLPFADMSPGKDQEYLADGVAEEILNGLAQVDGLRVIGRTSSFSFKGSRRTIAEIGRELNVVTVLEGSVRKSGNRVRIAAKLVQAADGSHLWAQTFDRDLADVFAVQDEISRAVVAALRVRLLPGRTTARSGATYNREALSQYLLGRDLLRSGDVLDAKTALKAFEKAVSLDPGFALAWAGVADALYWIEGTSGEGTSPERRNRALAAAERAVELAPDQPDGFLSRGLLRQDFLYDWQGARADVERARSLGPGDATSAARYGLSLLTFGDVDRAAVELERAVSLDPLRAGSWEQLGAARAAAADYEGAQAALTRALEVAPQRHGARWYLSVALVAGGRPAAALAVAEQSELAWARFTGVAVAQHDLGRPRESKEALEALVQANASDGAYQIAEVHAWRGETNLAFEWLERARQQFDGGMRGVKADPMFRKIRGDPRFPALLKKLNLPVD